MRRTSTRAAEGTAGMDGDAGKIAPAVLGAPTSTQAGYQTPANDTEAQESGVVQLKVMKPYSESPRRAFTIASACHCLLFFIFVSLVAGLGSKFLNQSNDVALHLWEDKWRTRADTLIEGGKIATYDLSNDIAQKQQEMARIPVGAQVYDLMVVYNARDGNMFTVDKLLKAKELEDKIVGHPDFDKFCLRVGGVCEDPLTVVSACTPSLCGIAQKRSGGSVPDECKVGPTDCSSVKSYPTGVFDCAVPEGCSRSDWSINEAFLSKKVEAYASAGFQVDFPETRFLHSVEGQFGSASSTASALLSVFKFGFPLEGYKSTEDRPDEQREKIETFMSDAYFELLDTYNREAGDDSPFLIGYFGGSLFDESVNVLLNGDFSLVGLAFLVVWLYVMCMTGSAFYSVMALANVFLCFTSGFILYRILYGSFFGTFHIMAIFLLVGVGVDNVFVFNDHYEAALQMDDAYRSDAWGRLSWTWKHAAVAMGVTSGTTATSFFMNATSSFPGIASFGVFAGCLCVVMYISMLLFWPAVVSFNHHMFKHRPFMCGIFKAFSRSREGPEAREPLALGVDSPGSAAKGTEGEAAEEQTEEHESKPVLVRFFEHHFSYFIIQFRIHILLVFAGMCAFMFVNIAQLDAAREAPKLLPQNHPINQFGEVMKTKFVRGGGDYNTKVSLVFGFDRDKPLHRGAADITGTGDGQSASTIGILGDVRWNPAWTNSTGDDNLAVITGGFDCFIQLCDSAEVKQAARNTGGPPAYTMRGCFPRDVRDYIEKTDASNWMHRWSAIVQDADTSAFYKTVQEMKGDNPAWYQEFEAHTFVEKIGGITKIRYFVADVTLTSDLNMRHEDGKKLAESWEAWLGNEMGKGECMAVANTYYPFVHSDDFHQFEVTATLMSEMMSGVMVSIVVSLVVLVAVTGNIIVGSVAALTIALIVSWVMAMIPILGWQLGIVECIVLVMVPGLSVDFTAHMAESYNQAKYEEREFRVVHALEHSGVSIVSGSMSTMLAGLCLMLCQIRFFPKFGTMLMLTVFFAVLFSLFFFPAVMAFCGPTGSQGDWHKYLHPVLQIAHEGRKRLRVAATRMVDGERVLSTRPPVSKPPADRRQTPRATE